MGRSKKFFATLLALLMLFGGSLFVLGCEPADAPEEPGDEFEMPENGIE